MKTTRFTDEQIIGFLKQAEADMLLKVAKFILICDGEFEVETFPLEPYGALAGNVASGPKLPSNQNS
jgi:hypothetical protein